MKLTIVAMLMALLIQKNGSSFVRAFVPTTSCMTRKPTVSNMATKSDSTSSSTEVDSSSSAAAQITAAPFVKGPRIIMDDLPIVYVYDHCPFCVRVRVALGIKNVKHTVHFMANDDVKTPSKLVGKKIAPIFEIPADKLVMAESLDIIAKIESDERFGQTETIRPASTRTDLKAWQKSVQTLLRTLQRPRYVATGLLPEFQQIDGRHAFIQNHQLPPYEKKEWKGKSDTGEPLLALEEKLKLYAECMASDPAPLVEDLNAKLIELDDILYSEHYCTEGGLSLDDVDLWSRLRSITIIKGVEWPKKLRKYMDNLSALADVPLYDQMAI